jgi:hypothetical protein
LKDDACTKPIVTTNLFPAQILGGPLGIMSLDASTTQINIMVNNVLFKNRRLNAIYFEKMNFEHPTQYQKTMPTRCKDICVYRNNSTITQQDAKTLPNLCPGQAKLADNNADAQRILYKTKTDHSNSALLVSTKFEREIPRNRHTLEYQGHIPAVYQGQAMHC